MAAFLGYLAGSTELVSGPHKILPYRGYEPGLTPPEQWDAIPLYGKLQIIVLVGMLESYGEILDPHYTNGGLPGYYPPIKGKRPELVFNLFDPFGFFEQDSPEKKARGRRAGLRPRAPGPHPRLRRQRDDPLLRRLLHLLLDDRPPRGGRRGPAPAGRGAL